MEKIDLLFGLQDKASLRQRFRVWQFTESFYRAVDKHHAAMRRRFSPIVQRYILTSVSDRLFYMVEYLNANGGLA